MAGMSILKYILDNCSPAKIKAAYHVTDPIIKHEQIDYISGDLKSLDDCRAMVRGCDCAIMAAAYAGGADFVRSFPWQHMKENLDMNMCMLEAFHLENVKRIIFIGSAAVYQAFEGSIRENELDFNKDPHQAYFGFAWGMRFIEKMCEFLSQKFGMEIIIVRLANIFGPYDKFEPQRSNFIPALVRKAVDKMDPFEVWGTPDVTRDVLFSSDFAEAIAKMLEKADLKFEIFNLGSGKKTTVGEVVTCALQSAGHNPRAIKYVQDKPMTIKFRALDVTKVKMMLGWEPRNSVDEGIRKTVEWWKTNQLKWLK